jgi:hypothetical protein
MAFEQRDGDGSLFANDRKQTQQHPDLTGTLTLGGIQYYVSAWHKQSKDGTRKYLSLSVRPKQQKSPPATSVAPKEESNYFDDRLPF